MKTRAAPRSLQRLKRQQADGAGADDQTIFARNIARQLGDAHAAGRRLD